MINPVESGDSSFLMSRNATDAIVEAVKNDSDLHPGLHMERLREAKINGIRMREDIFKDTFERIIDGFDLTQQRAILRGKEGKISSWLTVMPLAKNHFDLSAQEFRDALSIRYKKPLLNTAEMCDGCGTVFSYTEAQ